MSNYCIDRNGDKIIVGDKVRYWDLIPVDYATIQKIGTVFIIGDMNENHKDMPYLKNEKGENIGAWSKEALEKIKDAE